MIIIDRFDGDFAIIHSDEDELKISCSLLPRNTRPGDVLVKIDDRYIVDKIATQSRHDMLTLRFNSMKKMIK